MDTWLPAVGKSPAGLLMPLLVSLKTSIMWSTLKLEFSALCCSNLPPAAHLPPGLVSSPLVRPPITWAQLRGSWPSHQPLCLASLWRSALQRSSLVVTLRRAPSLSVRGRLSQCLTSDSWRCSDSQSPPSPPPRACQRSPGPRRSWGRLSGRSCGN